MKYTISFPEKAVLIEWDVPDMDQQPADRQESSQTQRWCVSNSKTSLVAYYATSLTYDTIPYPRAVPRVFGRQYWYRLGAGDKALYAYSWDRPDDVTSCWIERAVFQKFELSVRDFDDVPDLHFKETKSGGLSGRLTGTGSYRCCRDSSRHWLRYVCLCCRTHVYVRSLRGRRSGGCR
eukprot:GHVU01223094.1.p1 GENE.GHVU01223094.1~~GHVU01223094.1.p1  ORF type:complete len:192 (-),score=12.77 GHVU01223094.1:69-602(-)